VIGDDSGAACMNHEQQLCDQHLCGERNALALPFSKISKHNKLIELLEDEWPHPRGSRLVKVVLLSSRSAALFFSMQIMLRMIRRQSISVQLCRLDKRKFLLVGAGLFSVRLDND
jgi:hypothetical protein